MSPRFVLGLENVPCVAEVVNRSLKADCTDFTLYASNVEQTMIMRPASYLIFYHFNCADCVQHMLLSCCAWSIDLSRDHIQFYSLDLV